MLPISFKEAMDSAERMDINWEDLSVRGYFTDSRVDPDSLPKGWRRYEFRGSDWDWGRIATVEGHVWVNFCGTFLTKAEIPLNNLGYRECADEVNWSPET